MGATGMMLNDLSYGGCGVPLHSVKYYLKDWQEGGYTTRDEPNPRGEIVISGPIVAKGRDLPTIRMQLQLTAICLLLSTRLLQDA